ncbi:MAG: DUF4440 domain-containing protein [Streptosporangiales bacterium]|nr:DUF4440 domain-containing protein [Streptosporangiales bacterium]
MTTNHDHFSAATDDEFVRHLQAFAAAFNSGDVEALDRLYEDQGVLIPVPGRPAAGPDRTAAFRYLVDRGVPMEARLRRSYVAGDIALLLVDWSIRGTDPFGSVDPPR